MNPAIFQTIKTIVPAKIASKEWAILLTFFALFFSVNSASAQNDPPVVQDAVFAISEGASNGDAVGTVSATDPEGDPLGFGILSGDDDGVFAIDNDGLITVADNSTLDFNLISQYVLTVEVGDNINPNVEATITVNITDFNFPPEVEDQAFSIDENSAGGTVIGTVVATDDGSVASFDIISGDPDGFFNISNGGELTVAGGAMLNHELVPQYALTVRVTETGGAKSSDATVTVNINDVNDTPTIASGQVFTVSDQAANNAAVGTVQGGDEDESDIPQYSIVAGDVNEVFRINAVNGFINIRNSIPLNNFSSYALVIRLEDDENAFVQETVTVNVESINLAPVIENQVLAVDENSPGGTVVGTVVASDPNNDVLTFAITAGNDEGKFTITTGGQISVTNNAVLDRETTPSILLTVQATDDDMPALSSSASVLISLNDANEPPLITPGQVFTVSDAAVNDDEVGTVEGSDPEGEALEFNINNSNPAAAFAIDNTGLITVSDAALIDFATNTQFILTIQIREADGDFPSVEDVTINVEQVVAAPTVEDQTFTLAENPAKDAVIDTVKVIDPDTPLAGLSFSILSGNDSSAFSLSQAGILSVSDSTKFDFESNPSFSLVVQVKDALDSAQATITVNLTNVNEQPEMVSRTIESPENITTGGILGSTEASDPDGSSLTFDFVSGNGNQLYSLSNDGNILSASDTYFDFENFTPDTLVISATDGTLTTEATFIIILQNVNEGIVFADTTYTVEENSAVGTLIGELVAEDVEGNNLTYSITSGNVDGAFAVNGQNLIVENMSALDFEISPVFELEISVTDGEFSETAAVTVTITDVFELINDVPQFAAQDFFVEENVAAGTEIGQLVASDSVAIIGGVPVLRDNEIVFQLISQSFPGAIALDSLTGRITVASEAAFDFENPGFGPSKVIILQVSVSDGFLSTSRAVTIEILNVPEPPMIEDQEFTIAENTPSGTLIGKVDAVDGDGTGLTLRIADTIPTGLFMNGAGTMTVGNSTLLNFEERQQIVVTVEATDEVDTVSATITVNITNQNDPPRINTRLFELAENPEEGDLVGNINVTDEDGTTEFILTLDEGNLDSAFTLLPNGDLIVKNNDAIDFEIIKTFTLMITASDGELSDTDVVEIQITDVIDNVLITSVDDQPKIEFYPNPVRDRLMITFPGNNDYQVTISDLSGRVMMSEHSRMQQQFEIDVYSFQPGIYLLIIDQQVFKFRKQ